MEPIVFDQSPLADYLRDEGEHEHAEWASAGSGHESSPPSSPRFAPTGLPMVRARFRSKIPSPLRVDIPNRPSLRTFRTSYSTAVASRIDRVDNSKFLEQFRYIIVASQLLSGHSILSQNASLLPPVRSTDTAANASGDSAGALITVLGALGIAVSASWIAAAGGTISKTRVATMLFLGVLAIVVAKVLMRRRWLRYRRHQALSEITEFVSNSLEFDSAIGAAVALIQEVELVSRGYRISAPLPPVSRLEDRAQTRRCVRLRKTLRNSFADVMPAYQQTSAVVKGFSEQLDLEKYYDIYDISDYDMSDALQGFSENEFEDPESLRVLKILAARFHTIRKMFLCALLALDVGDDHNDLLRWTTAVEAISTLNAVSKTSFERLRSVLSEQDAFPAPPTPKLPLTPGRERWRSQLRKLNSFSSGIRGLQAKMQLLREESEKTMNETEDLSEHGSNLMAQYESIGVDLKALMQAWEEGKAALASGIDRNEKRLSSMSTLLSPTTSLSGVTTVEEGGTLEAFKALTGESPSTLDFSSTGEPDAEEVFEAVAKPRPRSLLTRDERIAKMKEEREKREIAKEKSDATRGMLRELEMVINLRPKRTNTTPSRVVSM